MTETGNDGSERIARRLARAGLCSRREAERWIADRRVTLDGATVESPALNVLPTQKIAVDGREIPAPDRVRLWCYHKPRGLVTTTSDPQGRATVFSSLPDHLPRVMSVGRLDLNTEGLLLLTNDGALARRMELPANGWMRRYRVRAHGHITRETLTPMLTALSDGGRVGAMQHGPVTAQIDRMQGDNCWLSVSLREGRNREIRKILEALDLTVNRLIRVSYGPFQLGNLSRGAVREVPHRVLQDQLGQETPD